MSESFDPALTVLVAYASRAGSTRTVAERLAARLGEHGLRCDLSRLPAANPTPYGGVLLGSAVYSGAWLPEALEMIRQNEWVLSRKSVWTFSVGRLTDQRGLLRRVAWPDAQRDLADVREAIHPQDHQFFAGAIHAETVPRLQRIIFRGLGGRYGDFQEWDRIDNWATKIALDVVGNARRPLVDLPVPGSAEESSVGEETVGKSSPNRP